MAATLWTVFVVILLATAGLALLRIALPIACAVGYSWYRLPLPRHLVAEPAPSSPLWSEIDNTIDLALGMTEYRPVDVALRAYAPKIYRPGSF